MNIHDDILYIVQALLDEIEENNEKSQTTVYSFYDPKRIESKPYYKNDNSISKMADLGLLKIKQSDFNSKPIDTSTIFRYFFYDVEFLKKDIEGYLDRVQNQSSKKVTSLNHKDNIYEWKHLKLNITQGTIQYDKNPIIEVSPERNEIKLLRYLFDNQKIVEYQKIAEHLKLNSYHVGDKNHDVARDVQFVKRDLLEYLKTVVGMPKYEVKQMIITKRNEGLKLHF